MDRRDLAPAGERVRPSRFDLSSEDIIICPYNRNHKIRKVNFSKHLKQCREQNLDKGLKICLFNYGHHVHGEQMDEHLLVKF